MTNFALSTNKPSQSKAFWLVAISNERKNSINFEKTKISEIMLTSFKQTSVFQAYSKLNILTKSYCQNFKVSRCGVVPVRRSARSDPPSIQAWSKSSKTEIQTSTNTCDVHTKSGIPEIINFAQAQHELAVVKVFTALVRPRPRAQHRTVCMLYGGISV